ncbi:hypothetical protein [Methanogenium organophilum]|uniref:Uncharacterized protein n=1 Tax=Methanogenium organophilum TaxID=2199 RepID=A0A9X9S642_METOG|nr:hypothetical protein [Methanogenium organophilum]WAI02113.1 hypothetical protein OU421_04380 [Methanogenium organophilum]
MARALFPLHFRHITLIAAVALCLILFCSICGCLSIPPGTDEGEYQPSTFEPTVRPTHIPVPSPTIVSEPTDNRTGAGTG